VEGIAQVLEPNEYEATVRSNGYPVWLSDLLWQTTNMVKAGWLTKDGSGMWTLTDAGVAALDDHVDPADFLRTATRLFNEWRRERDLPRRRAWLVRGSSVLGVNV